MIAIAIDDEPLALEVVRSLASRVSFVELKEVFTDAFRALDYLQKNKVDLLFLDIKMPDISGIEFLKGLTNKPLVIFTTAYSEHAVTSFDLDAVDYLLKPFSMGRFLKACTKANELFELRMGRKPTDHTFIKTGYERVKVNFEDICYIEAEGNYASFVLTNGKLLSRMTFVEIESILPPNEFIRVHRSYIVSKKHIDRIEKHQLSVNGTPIPIGENYVRNLSVFDERK